jgi:hypothetical protein
LDAPSTEGVRVDIWGMGATDLDVNVHLQSSFPCIDRANDTTAPFLDPEDNARCDDPATDNCVVPETPECDWNADMGVYEYLG